MSAVGTEQGGPPSLRIAPVLSVLLALAAAAGMVSGVVTSTEISAGSLRTSILLIAGGFGASGELCLVVAVLLLLIDGLTGGRYQGRRLGFGILALVAAVGVAANLAAAIDQLTLAAPPLPTANLIEAKASACLTYLAPATLAGLAVWLAVRGAGATLSHPKERR